MAGIMGSTDDFLRGKAFAYHKDSYRISHALEDLPPTARWRVATSLGDQRSQIIVDRHRLHASIPK